MTDSNRRPDRTLAGHRRLAFWTRLSAAQALYQIVIETKSLGLRTTNHSVQALANLIAEDKPQSIDRHFFERLCRRALDHQAALDQLIIPLLQPNWSWDRLAPMMRICLRLAIFELRGQPVKPNAIIDDYVRIGHEFCDQREANCINAVLDRFVKESHG